MIRKITLMAFVVSLLLSAWSARKPPAPAVIHRTLMAAAVIAVVTLRAVASVYYAFPCMTVVQSRECRNTKHHHEQNCGNQNLLHGRLSLLKNSISSTSPASYRTGFRIRSPCRRPASCPVLLPQEPDRWFLRKLQIRHTQCVSSPYSSPSFLLLI